MDRLSSIRRCNPQPDRNIMQRNANHAMRRLYSMGRSSATVVRSELPSPMGLRGYQLQAITAARDLFVRGHKRIVICQPTGCGKTVTGAEIARRAAAKGRRAFFVCDQINLVRQTSRRFAEWDIPHGIVQSDHDRDTAAPVLIASAQTLERRLQTDGWAPAATDIVILDECHVQRESLLSLLKDANTYTIGLSATPCAAGMGSFFEAMHCQPTQWFFDHGFLIRPTFVSADPGPQADLARSPVREWLERFPDPDKRPPTLCYSNTVDEARHLALAFKGAGVAAAHICGDTRENTRARLFGDYETGRLKVLCSCVILVKGFDSPRTQCLIVAKRVASLIPALQLLGRGMRAAPNKSSCMVLDHSGFFHGLGLRIEFHWLHGFNQLALDILGSKRMQRKLARVAVSKDDLRYIDKSLLPTSYRPDLQLWCDTCRWVADRTGIVWTPDAKAWDTMPSDSREYRAYWIACKSYLAITGGRIKLKTIRQTPFFASERCPDAVAMGLQSRMEHFRAQRDRKKAAKGTQPPLVPIPPSAGAS